MEPSICDKAQLAGGHKVSRTAEKKAIMGFLDSLEKLASQATEQSGNPTA